MSAIGFNLRPHGKVAVLCACGFELYLDPLSPLLAEGISTAKCEFCTGSERHCPCRGPEDSGMACGPIGTPCKRCGSTELFIEPTTVFRSEIVWISTEHGAVRIGPAAEVMDGLNPKFHVTNLCCGSCDNHVRVPVSSPACRIAEPECPVCHAALVSCMTATSAN